MRKRVSCNNTRFGTFAFHEVIEASVKKTVAEGVLVFQSTIYDSLLN